MSAPDGSTRPPWRALLAPLILTGAVLALGGLWAVIAPQSEVGAFLARQAAELRALALAHPLESLLLYALAYALAVAAMLPVALILTFASGFVLGPAAGAVGSIAGATLGAAIIYGLGARSRGRPASELERRFPRLGALRRSFVRHPFRYTLSLRLMPLTPFTLVSLAAGLNRIGWAPFLLGTMLGVTPECVLYPIIGAEIGGGAVRNGSFSPMERPGLLLGLAALAVFSFLAPALGRRLAADRG